MKILLSGSSGLVAKALTPQLLRRGDLVSKLVRVPSKNPDEIYWDPEKGAINAQSLEGFDAVVHLAGESIAGARWSEAQKKKIRDSRVNGTQLLSETLAKLSRPPKIFLCASAIGFYGDRGAEILTEDSSIGSLFLSKICKEWESAAQPAAKNGVRVVNLRFGIILSAQGGALAKMLFPFRMGLGGVIGSGKQYMSWISIDDAVGAITHVMNTESVRGPVNVTAPAPVTNLEFTKTLGKVLRRPTIFPMPAFAARLAFGEMADELLLAGAKVESAKLKSSGYVFQHPSLESALKELLS